MRAEAVLSISAMRKEFLRYTQENACTGVFLNEAASLSLQLYEKRDSGADVFL